MKRQEKKKPINWTKVFIVAICVLFAFAMVATYLSPVIGSMRTIKPNESVTADITVRDAAGLPLITTNQQVYDSAPIRGFLLRDPMILKGGARTTDLVSVDAYNQYTGWVKFSFLWLEVDEMNAAIVGMREGETKNVKFTFNQSLEMNVTAEDFEMIGGNFTITRVGDWFPIGFSPTPPVDGSDEPQQGSVRLANVLEKSNESMIITYRYSSVDVSIKNIGT